MLCVLLVLSWNTIENPNTVGQSTNLLVTLLQRLQEITFLPQVRAEHLENLRYVMVGAAPVGKALEQRWQAKAPGDKQ